MRECVKKIRKMAAILMALAVAVCLAGNASVSVQAEGKTNAAKQKKVAVIYFSATGTTKSVAKKIKKATKGNMAEIKATDPYTDDDLDYGEDDSRVTKEHNSADTPGKSSVRPKIKNLSAIKKAVKKADIVYIGYPIWWGEAPHIVYNMVENVSLKGKTVVLFCTSASSGLGKSDKNLKKNAKISSKTKWKKGKNFYDTPSQKTVNKWVKKYK